jgi:hypothetical protein
MDGYCIAAPELVKKLKEKMSVRIGVVYAKVLPIEKDRINIFFVKYNLGPTTFHLQEKDQYFW